MTGSGLHWAGKMLRRSLLPALLVAVWASCFPVRAGEQDHGGRPAGVSTESNAPAVPIRLAQRRGGFSSPPRMPMPTYRGGGTFSAPRARPLPQVRMQYQQRIDQVRAQHQQALALQQQQSLRMAQEAARRNELRQRLATRRTEMEAQFRRQREQRAQSTARAAAASAGTLAVAAILMGSPRMALGEPLALRLHCLTDGPAADESLRPPPGAAGSPAPSGAAPLPAAACQEAASSEPAGDAGILDIPSSVRARIMELARQPSN